MEPRESIRVRLHGFSQTHGMCMINDCAEKAIGAVLVTFLRGWESAPFYGYVRVCEKCKSRPLQWARELPKEEKI